jgi:hypothetical protein
MNRRPLNNSTILLIILVIYAIVTSVLTARNGGDFDVYLDAAQKLSQGKNIYQPPFIKGLQYYYSVFFALLLIPFSFHFFLTEFIWSLLSYLMLYRTFHLVKEYFNFPEQTTREYKYWVILTLILSFQFIQYNVSMIQVTFFLLWSIFESINLLSKNKFILSGLLLGLAINIKLMPVLILPYLFYRGYFKTVFTSVLIFGILLFIPALFIGFKYNAFLLSEWWSVINPVNKEHMFETGIGTHSLVSLIPVYLTETTGEMEYKRNLFNLSTQTVELIIHISRLIIFLTSLFYLKSIPFIKEAFGLKRFWELSFFVLMIPLLFPHQQKYAFLLALPMISYLLYFFIMSKPINMKTGYLLSLFLFSLSMLFYSPLYGSDIIGRFLFNLTQHYRILTIATLLIIPISLYCNPDKLKFETT